MKKHVIADISLLFVTVTWGSTFPLCKIALESMDTFNFLAIRFLIAFAILSCIFWKKLSQMDRSTLKNGSIIGLLLFFAYATQTIGINYTSSSKAGFINGFSVILVPVLSTILVKNPPKRESIAGILIAIAGLVLLTLSGSDGLSINAGDVIVLVSTFGYALQIISVSHYSKHSDPINLSIVQIGVVTVLCAAFTFIFEKPQIPSGSPAWASILLTAVLATALAFLVQNTMQKHTTPTRAALIYLGEPVFSAIFSYFMLSEVMSAKGAIGCALIFAGMAVSEVSFESFSKKHPAPSESIKRAG